MIKLQKSLRVELKEILDLAKEIKSGSSQAALHLLNKSEKALHFNHLHEGQNLLQIQHQLEEKVRPYLSSLDVNAPETLNHFRILSPLRRGMLGVDQLNAFFYKETLKRSSERQSIVIPIMITANASKQELYNGDVGFLIKHKPFDREGHPQRGDYALFSGKKIPAFLLPRYEYAYCLSVHKCQGSEFDRVLLLMPPGSEHFGRELVYTAVTRARHQLEIWSTPTIVEKALKHTSARLSRR